MAALSKITTIRDFERELPSITKIFSGKESDGNWEAREQSLTALRDLIRIQASETDWKEALAKGVQILGDGIARSVNSLRTALALVAIGTVEDICTHLGHTMNAFTIDLLLISLLRCSSTTKKVIATHAMDATTKLLSSTPYRQRSLQHVCNMMQEKNVQTRHYAAIYIKTLLTAHGANTSMMDKSGGLDMAENCVRKGLLDAAPLVREASRQIYVLLQQYWPARAKRLCQSLDVATQTKLSRLSNVGPGSSSPSLPSTTSLLPPPSPSGDTRPSRSRLMSQPSRILARPLSHRPTPSISMSLPSVSRRPRPPSSGLVTIPSKRRRDEVEKDDSSSGSTSESRRSSMASVSTASSGAGDIVRPSGSYLAAASLLQMLRSNDMETNCKGLRRLASKLKHCPYNISQTPVLPQDVPSFTNLYPLVMEYLSRDTDNVEFHETLVSWDCLAGVFTRVLCLHHYVPPIVLASQSYRTADGKPSMTVPTAISRIYSKGAARLKFYLKHCDPELPGRLLNIFMASQEFAFPAKYKHYLIQWIDELLCEYVGLLNDDDDVDDDIKKGAEEWTVVGHLDDQTPAYRWFDDEANTKKCLTTILPILENTGEDAEEYSTLLMLVGRLRMSNERVFDAVAHRYGRALEQLTYTRPNFSWDQQPTHTLDEFDTSLESIRLEEDVPMEREPHTDTTQEFSNLLVSTAIKKNSKEAMAGNENNTTEIKLAALFPKGEAGTAVAATKGRARWSRELGELLPCLQQQHHASGVDIESVLKRLAVASEATPVLQHEHIYSAEGDLWIGSPGCGRYFLSLMETLIGILLTPSHLSHKDLIKVQAIALIRSLLINQAGVLNYYEQRSLSISRRDRDAAATTTTTTTTTTMSNDSVSCVLAKALLAVSAAGVENRYERKEMSTTAREALDLLTITVPGDVSVRMLWALLGDEQVAHDKETLSMLFSKVEKFAHDVPRDVWMELLGNGSVKILVQGTNHPEATVRRACVQAIVGIYRVVGDVLLVDQLAPSLRVDQIELLKHYIHKKK